MATSETVANINEVRKYFGIATAAEFSKEWRALSADDKAQIKAGIGDGTLTY